MHFIALGDGWGRTWFNPTDTLSSIQCEHIGVAIVIYVSSTVHVEITLKRCF